MERSTRNRLGTALLALGLALALPVYAQMGGGGTMGGQQGVGGPGAKQ